MPAESFALHASARNVIRMLRAKLQDSPEASAELHAAIELIQALWQALQEQSDVLARERQRFADFFEYAPDAYVVAEPHGAIREANRAARELLDLPRELSEEASLLAFVAEPERPDLRARLVMLRGRPEAEVDEWEGNLAVGANGGVRRAQFRARPIKARRKNAKALCLLIRPLG